MLSDYIRILPFFFLFQFSSMMCQLSVVESKSATFPTEKPRHLLDDSVLESHSPVRNHTLNSVFTNGISIGKYAVVRIQESCWIHCLSVSSALKFRETPRNVVSGKDCFIFRVKKACHLDSNSMQVCNSMLIAAFHVPRNVAQLTLFVTSVTHTC